MPNLAGSFSGKSSVQTSISCHDIPEHKISIMELSCPLIGSEDNWQDAQITLWGTADLIQGFGPLRGYFAIEHPNGDSDCGTYDGHLAVVNRQVIMEGTWRYTHGTGQFASISGNGRYKGRMISASQVEISWQGNYQIAAGTRAA
jgi:hypothetical protein